MNEPDSRIGSAGIDAIVKFLVFFEADGFVAGEWIMREGQFPHFSHNKHLSDFIQAIHDHGWIVSFDWPGWRGIAEQFVESDGRVSEADADAIGKLLTTDVRAKRFSDGHCGEMFQSEHIVALFRRLEEVHNTQ